MLTYFRSSDSSSLSISSQYDHRTKVCIYSLIQIFEMFADDRNGPNCVCDFIFKAINKRTTRCFWFYHSYFTQNFNLINPFYNFFFHIGIFKFLRTNCPSKISVSFIGDLNIGFRKYLSRSVQSIWLNHKPCFRRFRVVTEFRTNDS